MKSHLTAASADAARLSSSWRLGFFALACMTLAVGPTTADAATSTAPAAQDRQDVRAVPELDVDRYMGTWFEIAKFPNYFQRKCAADTQATYTKRADGGIDVLNSCKTSDGRVEVARGLARPDTMPPQLASKLQVRFAPAWLGWLPFVWGRYWVVILDPEYRYAVVSEPRRKYLWILARSPHMEAAQYDEIVAHIQTLGFDTLRLVRSVQNVTQRATDASR